MYFKEKIFQVSKQLNRYFSHPPLVPFFVEKIKITHGTYASKYAVSFFLQIPRTKNYSENMKADFKYILQAEYLQDQMQLHKYF